MIVYIFYSNFFKKLFLPNKVVGIYPVYLNENKLLLNIEGIDGKWYIKISDNVSIYEARNQVINPELKVHTSYVVSMGNINLFLIAAPIYDSNSICVNALRKEFTVGSNRNNDISFNNGYVGSIEYKISYNESGFWHIQAATSNVYVNDKMVTSTKLYAGDYIFCFGLKIICLGKQFIISNFANVYIKDNVFVLAQLPSLVDYKPEYELSEDTPLYDKNNYFMKSPRFVSESDSEKVIIDLPPEVEKNKELPAILTIGPQLTMLSVSLLSVSNTVVEYIEGTIDASKLIPSAVMVFAMIAGVMIWPVVTRFYNRRQSKKREFNRQEKYKKYLENKRTKINNLKITQRELLFEKCPRLTDCQLIIENRKSLLWKRNIDDNDFLNVCLGIGTVLSQIDINLPEEHFSLEDDDQLITMAKSVISDSKYIDNAPYLFSLTDNYVSAVVGEKTLCDKLLDNLFLQIMSFHAYSDLKIVVYINEENTSRFEYLKILPHCWDNQHSIRYFATNIEEFNELTSGIDDIFELRKSKSEDAQLEDNGEDNLSKIDPYKLYKPYYLIFTDNINAIRNVSLVKKILNYRKNLGFSLLIENDRVSTLPDQTSSFISVNTSSSGLFTNRLKNDEKNEFKVDFENTVDMYYCSQILANIPILLEKEKYEIPKSLSFLQMYNVGRIEQLNSLERWKNNNPVNSLSVPVGIDQNGEIFKMDIHEKVYGPHGLIAGTTGSGKSEWIVTFILSLAVNYNPDEVQFVLIDYKGGGLAMSFENKELGVKLPHLAGTITNLDKSEINRSIVSIESELKRRQSIFNDAREKLKEGQMDIYKYQQYYRKGLVDRPLSHLLIICDEFAELKQQQPEFMEQLISTSRIGRSLGVHLILATQKPSGVVNDQIWSNSRFKVCLRVQDKSDSNEILKKPDAAYLKQVGAFYLEVGNDEYYNLGQAAWAGAKYYPSDVVKHHVDQSVQCINNIGKIVNYFDSNADNNKNSNSEGEELLNIVKYIDRLSNEDNFVKQQLWLPNISKEIYLDEIKKKYNFTPQQLNFTTVIGEYDEPRKQEQNMLKINLMDGNIAVVGQPGSGKEMLLSTIIFSSISEHTPQEINYYILDFGAETFRKFSKFPHVGEVVFQGDMERVGGVIQLIFDELKKRKELFQDYNGSLEYYNSHCEETLPLICLVINAFDVFSEMLSRIADSLHSLFRDAPRYGIIFILSASAQNTFRSRTLQYFNRFIVMNLQDEMQYRNLTNCRKGLIPSNFYGRGICKTGDDDDSYCEFQTAMIVSADEELVYLRELADMLSQHYVFRAKKITTIPDSITSADLEKYLTTIADLPIGYNFYEKDIAKLNLSNTKFYSIISEDIKTNIKFIYALANLLTKLPDTVVRVVDILNIFDKPILDIKLFKSELDAVFAALNKDVMERNVNQPLAINIILGAGSIKEHLNKTGQEFAENMFNFVINSKQNVFILVDDYKKFKLLKLQPWYNFIDTTNGIWLGTGIEAQSVLVSNYLSDDDKKYNYEGMAYLIKDSTYTLIKTMMDGDD